MLVGGVCMLLKHVKEESDRHRGCPPEGSLNVLSEKETLPAAEAC